jgi:aspartyl-tRNA(Asn)/glutamyl-tRNA(Gln) amidotransferase subunit B
MRYLDIADCKMAEGGMRLEANISLQPKGSNQLPSYKVEVKNINSFRFLQQAIDYEIKRQSQLLKQGQTPAQETRGFDSEQAETFSQRAKEEAADYRYFPDPDLPPIELESQLITDLKQSLPELPAAKIKRWQNEYQVEKKYALQLAQNRQDAKWAEAVFKAALSQELQPNDLANDIVNKKIKVSVTDKPAQVIQAHQKLHHTADLSQKQLDTVVSQVLTENPGPVEKYQAGKKQVLGFLIGQAMQKFDKKVDAKQVRSALTQALDQP